MKKLNGKNEWISLGTRSCRGRGDPRVTILFENTVEGWRGLVGENRSRILASIYLFKWKRPYNLQGNWCGSSRVIWMSILTCATNTVFAETSSGQLSCAGWCCPEDLHTSPQSQLPGGAIPSPVLPISRPCSQHDL